MRCRNIIFAKGAGNTQLRTEVEDSVLGVPFASKRPWPGVLSKDAQRRHKSFPKEFAKIHVGLAYGVI